MRLPNTPTGADTDPVGLAEIAIRLKVRRSTVDQWKFRGLMPPPQWTIGGSPAWSWRRIRKWASDTGTLLGVEVDWSDDDKVEDPDFASFVADSLDDQPAIAAAGPNRVYLRADEALTLLYRAWSEGFAAGHRQASRSVMVLKEMTHR